MLNGVLQYFLIFLIFTSIHFGGNIFATVQNNGSTTVTTSSEPNQTSSIFATTQNNASTTASTSSGPTQTSSIFATTQNNASTTVSTSLGLTRTSSGTISTGTSRPRIDIAEKFREWKIVPDLIDEPPKRMCQVIFKNITIQPGDFVPRRITQKPPDVKYLCKHKNKLHTLVMIGISNGTIKRSESELAVSHLEEYLFPNNWHNWIHINIEGDNVKRGQHLYEYIWPLNPQDPLVLDRYVILIYQQTHRIWPPTPKYGDWHEWQEFIPLQDFVRNFNLTGPIAGNFFYMKYEPGYKAIPED